MTYIQPPPFTVKVELSEGCNLACVFCGINGIRERPGKIYNFMTIDTATAIAMQLAALQKQERWNMRIEYTMHGEPSMNPQHPTIIGIFRRYLPKTQLMLTSNGGGMLRNTAAHINDLFLNRGLNILALDDYEDVLIVGKIRDRTLLDLHPSIRWYEYPADKEGNPHRRHPVSSRMVTVIRDLQVNSKAKAGTHSNIVNHCGAGGPRDLSTMGRKCAKPFRELAIRWNGEVAACCDDWRGEFKAGNIRDLSIGTIWQGARFMALRKKVLAGERDFGPCLGCTSRSFRTGLLPDNAGRAHLMPALNADDQRALRAATAGPPLATIVLRPWERKDTDEMLG